jgi:hypothetical protein
MFKLKTVNSTAKVAMAIDRFAGPMFDVDASI